jgi:hypothetical protein
MPKMKDLTDQLIIPFTEIIENLGIPANYNFSNLKKIFLPTNPLTDYPLFLPAKSKVVNNSRKRFRHIMEKKGDGPVPKIDVDDLVYATDDFTIKADMDYGLPDEFDGQVFDCIIMLISKEYVDKSKVFKGYRIDENIIMNEFIKRGMKTGGSLYNRIKFSLNRMAQTSYIISNEQTNSRGEIKYLDIIYRLIDAVYRKGERHPDGSEFSNTVILPHSAILASIEEKKYHIVANEKRYALDRYLSKVIYDKLHLVVYSQIFGPTKDIFIAQKSGTFPFFVIGYEKFCKKVGLPLLDEKDLRAGNIEKQLTEFKKELIKNEIIQFLEYDRKNTVEKAYNLIFVFTWDFVDCVFEMANKSMSIQGIDKLSKELIDNYFKKLEKQIRSKAIKNRIKNKKYANVEEEVEA